MLLLTSPVVSREAAEHAGQQSASQRSLHNAPIFRLLLKVAVNGTHQCDFLNFCGGLGPQREQCSFNGLHGKAWVLKVL
jgi:hypothetical protein